MENIEIQKWVNGSGYGSGYGSGDGDGYGSGSGSGYKIININNNRIYYIDGIPTIIISIFGNNAKGFTVSSNFNTTPCYIVKGFGFFAHGSSLKEAHDELKDKILKSKNIEDLIDEFTKRFSYNKKYKGLEFYKWHNILTGSCKFGRVQFVKDKNLDLNNLYTVKDFIKLTENSYRGDIIKKLKEKYECKKN